MFRLEHEAHFSRIIENNQAFIMDYYHGIRHKYGLEGIQNIYRFPIYFDKLGNAISSAEWHVLTNDEAYKYVAHDSMWKFTVTTVWLGYLSGEDSALFQTVINDGHYDDIFDRYKNLEDAIKGHEKAKYHIREMLDGKAI